MKRERPRQKDVAARAGVSTAVVSLVLNGRFDGNVRISEETRARVLDAMRELGYVADPAAQRLAGGPNHLMGVFTYERLFPLESHDFFYPFLVGIELEAERHGYDLLLFTRMAGSQSKRSVFDEGINRLQLADGAILLGRVADPDELARLCKAGYPFVFVGRRDAPEVQIPYIAAGYANATAEVVEHLVALGHRRLSYLRAPSEAESSTDRELGYRLAHQRLGLKLDERSIQRHVDVTPGLLRRILAGGATAIIAENRRLASKVLELAPTLGRSVPGDLSVAVLGDEPRAGDVASDLTTFVIPREAMGAEAVRLLARMLAGPIEDQERQVVLPCVFRPGRTTGPVTTNRALDPAGASK